MPIEEAQASIHVQPNAKDIEGATREDPTNCAYARCLRRVLDAPSVFVFKTVAYIQTLDESGRPRLQRYLVKTYARDYLMRFDHGEKVPPGGFVFHRPHKSATLAYKLKKEQHRPRSPHKKAGNKPKMKNYTLRKGTGCVHLFGMEDQITPRHVTE